MLFYNQRKAKSYTKKELIEYITNFSETINSPHIEWSQIDTQEKFLQWFNKVWKPAFEELKNR